MTQPTSANQGNRTSLTRSLEAVDRVLNGVGMLLMLAASILATVVMLWILASVLARAVGGFSVSGTAEVAANAVVALSLLCAPYVMRRGGHIRTGVVTDRLPASGQRIASVVAYLIGAVIFAFVAWAAWEPMVTSWATGEYSGEGSLRIPTGPLRTIVVIFAVVMVVECVLAALKKPRSTTTEPQDPTVSPPQQPSLHS